MHILLDPFELSKVAPVVGDFLPHTAPAPIIIHAWHTCVHALSSTASTCSNLNFTIRAQLLANMYPGCMVIAGPRPGLYGP